MEFNFELIHKSSFTQPVDTVRLTGTTMQISGNLGVRVGEIEGEDGRKSALVNIGYDHVNKAIFLSPGREGYRFSRRSNYNGVLVNTVPSGLRGKAPEGVYKLVPDQDKLIFKLEA